MSEFEDQPVLVTEVLNPDEDQPKSLAEQLRARRTEIAETKEVFLPIIGYEDYGLVAKHRLIERVEVEKIGRGVIVETRDRGERNMRILLDTIIRSTTGFYLQGEKDPKPVEDDRNGDSHVLTWNHLGYYLGWEPEPNQDDSRTALYWVFGFNEFAIGQYGIMLNRWMGNTGVKIDEEFLGEVL